MLDFLQMAQKFARDGAKVAVWDVNQAGLDKLSTRRGKDWPVLGGLFRRLRGLEWKDFEEGIL